MRPYELLPRKGLPLRIKRDAVGFQDIVYSRMGDVVPELL
jgi:hypothetical protein